MKKTRSHMVDTPNTFLQNPKTIQTLNMQETNIILMQLLKERENYKQQLKMAHDAIQQTANNTQSSK
jgi:hypothetical protein